MRALDEKRQIKNVVPSACMKKKRATLRTKQCVCDEMSRVERDRERKT